MQTKLDELAERCLHSNSYLAMKNISCESLDGVLTLRGHLPTYYLKQIAQMIVAQVEGVKHIDNQIEVITPAFPSRGN
jgi:osmotically-inducible protein OsmY